LSTVLKLGVAGFCAISILAVAKGLPASPRSSETSSPTVQAPSVDVAPSTPPPPVHPISTDPIPVKPRPIGLAALRDLVDLQTMHPRPLGPETACLARTVYLEASNQTLKGQLAVAQVVLNRMKSHTYPRSACAVVGQHGQFAQADDDSSPASSKPWTTAVAIANIAEDGRMAEVAPGAMFFHATYVSPAWSQDHERIGQVGDHIFYR